MKLYIMVVMKMEKLTKIVFLWLPPVIWALSIFTFSALPSIKTTNVYWQDFVAKKIAHMTEYGILGILLYRALKESKVTKGKAALWAIFIAFLYGITDEYHQSFTPGREPRVRDVIFDTIGAGLAIYLVWRYLPKAPKKLRAWGENWRLL